MFSEETKMVRDVNMEDLLVDLRISFRQPSIRLTESDRPPHEYIGLPNVIYIGKQWLEENLTEEQIAQWAVLRIEGRI